MRFRLLGLFFKDLKETQHHPEITNFLSNNESFVKGALKVHDLKNKFWQKVDEAAFPENYVNEKLIEDKRKKK